MKASFRQVLDNRLLLSAAVLLASSFVLAATSAPMPLRGMIVQLVAIATILVTLLHWRAQKLSIPVWIALLAIPAVPLLQLIPLPPAIWQALPGREIATEIALLAGGSLWRPLSLDPNATLRSFLGLLPPVAMFLAASQMRTNEHKLLIWVLLAMGLLSAFLGALQVVSGSDRFYLLTDVNEGLPTGLFGNRNHQASFMALCALFSYALLALRPLALRPYSIVLGGLVVLFAAVVFATGSRAGVALLLILAVTSPFLLSFNIEPRKIAFGSLIVLAVSVFGFTRSRVVLSSLERFNEAGDDGRYDIWPDVLFAIGHYLPFGSGAGTFTESFQPFEALNLLSRFYVPRAHNDYLELTLEIGLIAIPLILAVLGLVAYRSGQILFRGRTTAAWLGRAMALAVFALALHSVVDYPVQTVALGTTLGLALGILFAEPSARDSREAAAAAGSASKRTPGWRGAKARRQVLLGALLVGAVALSFKAVSVGMSDSAVRAGNYASAARTWPASANAQAGWSEALLKNGQSREALRIAADALQLSSQSSFALRAAARAAEAADQPELAERTWALAARLGWRDGFVQDWVFNRSLAGGDYVSAARAADAMARTDFLSDLALDRLVALAAIDGGRQAVADSMAVRPPWSQKFVAALMRTPPDGSLALFVRALDRRDAVPEGRIAFPIFERLLIAGKSEQVVSIWQRRHATLKGDPRRGLVDAEFDVLANEEQIDSFFGWQESSDPGVLVQRDEGAGSSPSLRVETSTRAPIPVLHQVLALSPGSYRFEYSLKSPAGAGRDYFWEIECNAAPKSPRQRLADDRREPLLVTGEWTDQTMAFVIPGSGCAAQTLRLRSNGTLDEGTSASFAKLAINPTA